MVGNCENGYSCAYLNSTSWRTPNTPMPHERDPRVVFQRLFGDGGSVRRGSRRCAAIAASSTRSPRASRVSRSGSARAIARRSTTISTRSATSSAASSGPSSNNADAPLPTVEQPAGVPEEYDEHAKLLIDLLLLGYQADITRVSCMQIARESSSADLPWIGVPEPHHPVSHHQNDPHNIQQKTKINAYHMSLFGRLLEKMAQTPDGDGTLLDHSIMVYGAGMGDGDHHTPIDMPVVVAGGGCGQLQGGRHLEIRAEHAVHEPRPDAARQARRSRWTRSPTAPGSWRACNGRADRRRARRASREPFGGSRRSRRVSAVELCRPRLPVGSS